MKIVRGVSLKYIPAAHENHSDPGVLKKVLFTHKDLISGKIQMVNWAKLPAGKSFQPHYHEDMDEVFVIISGIVEIDVATEKNYLNSGDALLVSMQEVHSFTNTTVYDVEYIVFGISKDTGGKTVNTP